MAELAHFQNFAKLKDVSVEFNDITVLAGKPSTGKSYIMKMMYAINEALAQLLNGTYLIHYALMDKRNSPLIGLQSLKILLSNDDTDIKQAFELSENGRFIDAYKIIDEKLKDEKYKSKNILQVIKQILQELAKKQQEALSLSDEDIFTFLIKNILQSIFSDIKQISNSFEFTYKSTKITFSDNNFRLNSSFNSNKTINNVIFIETPLILEFEKFFPKDRFETPYHIDSLLNELRGKDYSFTSQETDEFILNFNKRVENIIKGNIIKSNNEFSYISLDGKSYDSINISSGTKSIGLLQYLVANKVLKRGSILFWEEPEVHLHPKWQLKMIELFLELMNMGVKIVFSTHSPYMVDYLNALSDKKGCRDRVSFNLLEETNSTVANIILDKNSWDKLQSELLDPLEEIAWEYL